MRLPPENLTNTQTIIVNLNILVTNERNKARVESIWCIMYVFASAVKYISDLRAASYAMSHFCYFILPMHLRSSSSCIGFSSALLLWQSHPRYVLHLCMHLYSARMYRNAAAPSASLAV
jgi:hypothetical protein